MVRWIVCLSLMFVFKSDWRIEMKVGWAVHW